MYFMEITYVGTLFQPIYNYTNLNFLVLTIFSFFWISYTSVWKWFCVNIFEQKSFRFQIFYDIIMSSVLFSDLWSLVYETLPQLKDK